MSTQGPPRSAGHVDIGTLADYWTGAADEAATQAIDEHLLGCDACGATLDAVIALAGGVRQAFAAGRVGAYLSARFVAHLARCGVRIREHRVPHNGSVNCSVAPDDQLLVGRFQVPLGDGPGPRAGRRVDAVVTVNGVEERRDDVPFDDETGEVLFAPRLQTLRAAPAHDVHVQLLAVDEAGVGRELGRYTLHHRPWAGA